MVKDLYYIKVKKENGRIDFFREVKAYINNDNKLVIHCCDINKTAEILYGDSGVEFYLIIDEKSKDKFASALKNKISLLFIYPKVSYTNQSLLDNLYSKFGEKDSCFEDIMCFLKKHRISYEYQRW